MRGKLIIGLVAVLAISVLLFPGARIRGRPLSGKALQVRRVFLAAAVTFLVFDLIAIAQGTVSGPGDVFVLLVTTVLPFTYLYWRFGGSFKLRSK